MAWLTKRLRKLFPWLLAREFDALNEHKQEHIRQYFGMVSLGQFSLTEFYKERTERNKRYHDDG